MITRWLAVLALLLAASRAHAQIDVDGALDGQRLDGQVTFWSDPTGAATLAQVRDRHAEFLPPGRRGLYFGLTSTGAHWIRIPVRNLSAASRTWMLEVGYPHLDHVTLYVPDEAGVATQEAGDMLPFSARAYRHPFFIFRIDEPAHSQRVLYMRVATHGVPFAPLRAWDERRFAEHHYLSWTVLFGFYGVALVMSAYNLLLFALTRLREYGLFALVVASGGFAQFVTYGHAFQFLVPDHVDLAQRLVPFALNLGIAANVLFAADRLYVYLPPFVHRAAQFLTPVTMVSALLPLVVPLWVSVILVQVCYALIVPTSVFVAVSWRRSRRAGDVVSATWANALMLGWLMVILGSALSFLTANELLPANRWTEWGFAFGATMQFVLVTAALASRVRWLQQELATVNDALQNKVNELGAAIDLTYTETTRAEAAANAKNEVIATMTHELRTPLNAIINIPEGLVERFREGTGARCRACEGQFALEPGEQIEAGAACPSCGADGTLEIATVIEHAGNATQSARYLEIVEKAGRHLAQVIDGILVGGHENRGLHAVRRDVVPLLEEVVEQMSAVASQSDVRLVLAVAQPALWLSVDALRFRQIVINLLGNAIKFSHRGSEVTVTARVEGTQAVFSVIDRGIGIPEGKRGSVFETFEQAHDPSQRRFGGTGLGLSIVRSLVRLHGGEVWLESEVGHGTTFHFSMPMRREAAA